MNRKLLFANVSPEDLRLRDTARAVAVVVVLTLVAGMTALTPAPVAEAAFVAAANDQ